MSRRLLFLAVLSGLLLSEARIQAAAPSLDPHQPYQATRSEPVTYEVDFRAIVTAPYKTKLLRVWLPIPPSDAAQAVTSRELKTFPQDVQPQIAAEPLFGNRFAYFEFPQPQGAQIIEHRFQVRTWQLNWQLDAAKIQAVSEWPVAFELFRRNESQAVVRDAEIDRLLGEIVPQRSTPGENLNRIMDWVQQNFKYDHINASLQASSRHAVEQRRGHCSDYHGFCAAAGRALGYPTRVTYGINPFPKNSPSHCKLEVFLPPYGWVSFDVSETQKLVTLIQGDKSLADNQRAKLIAAAQQRLATGFRDNTWFLQTRGTDYDLVPPAARRVAVVRTIYAEADGVPLADPDPANPEQKQFGWMTAHRYTADRPVSNPFADWQTLTAQP
ncbi:MAG: transglutaminase domain-containing protein [Planctomycetaceae bacterium]|nr:transglutaminase domain-containing protein [Planctomycetaceae bacterium]